jgi:hypothetical protein
MLILRFVFYTALLLCLLLFGAEETRFYYQGF